MYNSTASAADDSYQNKLADKSQAQLAHKSKEISGGNDATIGIVGLGAISKLAITAKGSDADKEIIQIKDSDELSDDGSVTF